MSRFLGGFLVADSAADSARRQRAEEWAALHRRPDAPPLPPRPERLQDRRLPTLGALARVLLRHRTSP